MTVDKKSSGDRFPIVVIGASAGGLHPLQCFLSVLPEKFGFSVVFMQHLSIKHKSLLAGLLNKARPRLDIIEVSDNLELFPGKIYLCPPGKDVSVRKGIFHTSLPPDGQAHLPIDKFFSSLSEEAGEKVTGVVFSGAGSDGARGIKEIRTRGGTVFVQDPATAEFASMPLAAISTGQADGVFKPEEIAREILKMQGAGEVPAAPQDTIYPAQFEDFYRLLHDKAGYNFNHYKKSVVARRIIRRMYLRGVTTVDDYLKLLPDNGPEINNLAFDLMIGVTSFFRDTLAWKALRSGVIRKLAAANDDYPIRVWTPASATGEEAYSIAMMLHNELELAGRRREIQVFATDVNERALEKAREGKYPSNINSEMSPDFMKKYFTYTEDGLSAMISKEIRGLVVFAKHDILTDPPFSKLDLIICRNLLIYLEPEAQEKCIALFHYGLKTGGHLFLGNAESPGRNISLFKSLAHKKCRIYEKTEIKLPARMPISIPFASEKTGKLALPQKAEEYRLSVTGIVQEALLEGYAPAAVAVDQNYDILYHNGHTNRFLCQPRGAPTQNLLELLPSSLRSRIRGGFYRAVNEGKHVSIRANVPCDDGKKRDVAINISPLRPDLFLVIFREKGVALEYPEETCMEAAAVEETAVHQLENELSATRQDLQSNIEQLKSLNEEMQSSNEELQAANEELETSREELQSLNEELITVNAQLQSKVEEQETTNNDLNNFLSSTNIPTVFLDDQFRVKRFTPAMSKLIKLIPSDVGRPIVDMSQEGLGPELIADAQAVLENLVPVKKELAIADAWYVRAVLPYRTADNRIEGVVVAYSDITDVKAAEERTRHLASFPQLNPNPIIEMDASGKVIFVNPSTQKVMEDLELDKKDVNIFLPADFDAVLEGLKQNIDATFHREVMIRDRVFAETVQLLPQFDVVRIYALDITERKHAEERSLRAREEWERTFASVPDMIAIIDNDHRVIRVNESMAKRLGRKPDECVGMKCYEAVHGTTAPIGICPHCRTLQDGSEHKQEVHEKRLGMDLLVTTTPLLDKSGNMIGSVHVAHDITERKKAEEELRRSEEHLSRAQELAHLGSWELDLVNNVLTWSDEVYRIFGLKPQEFGATYAAFLEAVHPEDRAAVDTAYSSSLREGRDTYEIEHRIVRKATDEIRYVLEKCEHFRDASGKIVRSVGMVHDVTERKQAEEEIKRKVEELKANNEELIRFNTAAVGRELRMIELKKEINELCEKAGLEPRYKIDFDEERP
ncbi:MAG: PAS domain S-box protein [Nitrospirae bacterium]|nr:PAS domain S-box protein [Nitrospirota bacterium]